jgi:hypothetical protein
MRIATHPVKLPSKPKPTADQVKKALIEAVNQIPEEDLKQFHIGQILIVL